MKKLQGLFLIGFMTLATASFSADYSTCIGCHGAQGEGGVGPMLAGQSKEDLTAKLVKYRSGENIGPLSAMMIPMATGLTDADIEVIVNQIAEFK